MLSTKVCIVKGMVFPVVMYGCESWTIKKAERQRTDTFELWCWRRLLRVPWTVRRSNQSILKEISPGCSLVELMLKLKLQYFGHLMRRVGSLEKTWCWERLMAGGERDDKEWDGWMASLTRWTKFGWTLGVGNGQGGLASWGSWGRKGSDMTEWLNWTNFMLYTLYSSKSFDKCTVTHHNYSIRWNCFTFSKIPCAWSIFHEYVTYSSLHPPEPLATTNIFTVSRALPFPECHIDKIIPYKSFQTSCFHLVSPRCPSWF